MYLLFPNKDFWDVCKLVRILNFVLNGEVDMKYILFFKMRVFFHLLVITCREERRLSKCFH